MTASNTEPLLTEDSEQGTSSVALVVEKTHRLEFLDLFRGFIMLIMAWYVCFAAICTFDTNSTFQGPCNPSIHLVSRHAEKARL